MVRSRGTEAFVVDRNVSRESVAHSALLYVEHVNKNRKPFLSFVLAVVINLPSVGAFSSFEVRK